MNLLRKVAASSEIQIQHASSQQVWLNSLENMQGQHQDTWHSDIFYSGNR